MKLLPPLPFKLLSAGLILIAAVLVLPGFFGKPLLSLQTLGIRGEEKTAVSDLLLGEIRDLYGLTTVEYVYKAVFPHDYMNPAMNFDSILQKLRTGTGPIKALLHPMEQDYLDAYNLALRIGLRVGKGAYDFIVVTAIIRGGFDLTGTALDPKAELSLQDRTRRFAIGESRDPKTGKLLGKKIRLELPKPIITDVVIEDPQPENYPFPDIKLKPEQWKLLAGFVEERARRTAEAEGLLETTNQNCREFLRALLTQAGFTETDFVQR